MPDVFKLQTRYYGREIFEGNVTTGNNFGSLFNIAVPPAKFSLHFMMPTSNIERGVFNMSSLFGLRFVNKEGEHKFDLNSVRLVLIVLFLPECEKGGICQEIDHMT